MTLEQEFHRETGECSYAELMNGGVLPTIAYVGWLETQVKTLRDELGTARFTLKSVAAARDAAIEQNKVLRKDVQPSKAMVECGECYVKYDARENENCPDCGSDEIVGQR